MKTIKRILVCISIILFGGTISCGGNELFEIGPAISLIGVVGSLIVYWLTDDGGG